MMNLKQWLFADTTIGELLAIRPQAISVLEKFGIDPFKLPMTRLGETCQEKGIAWETFLLETGKLEVPRKDSDWQQLPLFMLLDFLIQEHREIVSEFFPAIRNAIISEEKDPANLEANSALIREWPGFMANLTEHIKSEDTFLFPKILRYDYCARHDTVDPDFSKGSVKVFAALHLLMHEQRQTSAVTKFLDAMAFSPAPDGENDMRRKHLLQMMARFQKSLIDHSRLEVEVLFPLATALEKRLYDRLISGHKGNTKGEMV